MSGISSGKTTQYWETIPPNYFQVVLFLALACLGIEDGLANDFTEQFWQPAEQPHYCPTQFSPLSVEELDNKEVEPGKVVVQSDQYRETKDQERDFQGNVRVFRGDLLLKASKMQWEGTQIMKFPDGLELLHPDGAASIGQAEINLDDLTNTTPIEDLSFAVYELPIRGRVRSVEVTESVVRTNQMAFSSCQPSQEFWSFGALRTSINRESSRVTMRHFWLKAGGVPVFYFPFLTFKPEDQRSGFGTTRFDYRSDNGFIVKQPIRYRSKHFKTTLEPRVLSENGFQLGLTTRAPGLNITLDWIPNDLDLEDETTPEIDESRWRFKTDFEYSGDMFDTHVKWLQTSDFRYQHDFEYDTLNRAEFANTNSLGFKFLHSDFKAGVSVKEHVSTSTNEVLNRLKPEVFLSWRPLWQRLSSESTVHSETFETPQGEADRFHLEQKLGLDLSPDWADVKANGLVARTRYHMSQLADSSEDRGEHSVDLLAALHWDRFGEGRLTTISPTVFFIRRQVDELAFQPRLDTFNAVFQPQRLFSDTYSVSIDNRRDEERIVSGLRIQSTSFHKPRKEFSLDFAYVDDRSSSGPLVGSNSWAYALSYRLSSDVTLTHSQVLSPSNPNATQYSTLLLYSPSPDKSIHIATHKQESLAMDQTEVGLHLPLGRKVELFAGAHYDWQDEEAVESHLGLAIKGCCISTKLFFQRAIDWRFVDNRYQVGPNNRVMLQIELTGIGKLGGSRLDNLLTRKRFFNYF